MSTLMMFAGTALLFGGVLLVALQGWPLSKAAPLIALGLVLDGIGTFLRVRNMRS